jgi:alkyldihydroxyacetonephosphate synthase
MNQTLRHTLKNSEDVLDPDTKEGLKDIVGAQRLSTGAADRIAYSRDRLPYTTYTLREGLTPATLPSAIVQPSSEKQVAELLALAARRNLAVIPYGAGSGVLGGALPVCGEITIDLKELGGEPEIDDENMIVTVGAGMNGGSFEEYLNERGFTCGHHPQSMHMSTVGGWIACRGAGQMSSRYGKIEDMVLGLRAILPNGEPFEIKPVSRRAVGPGLMDLIIGSEGTRAVITRATMKIWRLPEFRAPMVVAFPTLGDAFGALGQIMRAGIRPTVARLYDDHESAEKAAEGTDLSKNPIMCIFEFAGIERLARTEMELARDMCAANGAIALGDENFDKWRKTRFSSYSAAFHAEGRYVETIEVTGLWSRMPGMYKEIRAAIAAMDAGVSFGAHWSHVYAEGACQYMTFRIPEMDVDKALELHARIWRDVQDLTLKHAGSISHHHGIGVFRNPWIDEELGGAMALYQMIKDAVDPGNILNPGKVGLTPRAGSVLPIKKEAR